MQIWLFGDAMTFSDFIFKGTLITKTPNGDEENSDKDTRYLYWLEPTWTYQYSDWELANKAKMLDIQRMIEALMPVFNWTGLWMVSFPLQS